jgi:nitrite reductase (NO-forming)
MSGKWWYKFALVLAALTALLALTWPMLRSSAPASASSEVSPGASMPGMEADGAETPTPAASAAGPVSYTPNVAFTLQTGIAEGRMVFIGVGGAIDGAVDPALKVRTGDVVQVTLINGEGAEHDVSFPDQNATSDRLKTAGASSTIVFRADKPGAFVYFCTVPGHRQAGMEGKLVVGEEAMAAAPVSPSISRDPADLPPPIGDRPPGHMRVNLETTEVDGRLADGTTYTFWTFNGQVPGPFLRVRQGDTVEIILKNSAGSHMIHSIDLHAVIGPGGGAAVMQVPPGQEKSFTFKALNPGIFVYHCATPMVAQHITNGMYGLILVEPAGGLPPVDREFYVMQGELYTQTPYGQRGHAEFSVDKLLAEKPEYFVFNGSVGALTQEHPLKAKVGETVRIFFGVGGPNAISSFHVIGEILDRVYDQGSLTAPPVSEVQTTLVPPGGATVVELQLRVPGRYLLVDHALARMERGLVGFLLADGPENPDIFHAHNPPAPGDTGGH